jgi:hypothetical protein
MNKQIDVVEPKLQTLYGLGAIDWTNPETQTAVYAVAGIAAGVVLYFFIKKNKRGKRG